MKDIEFINNKTGYSHFSIDESCELPNRYDVFTYIAGGIYISGVCTDTSIKEWSIEETMNGAPHFTYKIYYDGIDLPHNEIPENKKLKSYTDFKMEIKKPQKIKNDKYTIVFYQKENDKKFSFLIENEPELTETLLNSVKTKRVKEKQIKFAVKGIFEKLNNLNKIIKNAENMSTTNPITELSERIQSEFGANIETRVISKTGADHNPTVTVEIELPNGKKYKASGSNKRIAKRVAAENALDDLK